ncbi:hypothetical protein BDV98DRAFT_592151 [Pterulicium gracile]|uniref:Homeobox domain-containing protein n=1 Tax=Pterulicium gracile TaxID=1884261 RepID=A0A5C3QKC0_9AGAR|nr:hypothetical protein BDV98DRAFT_592151 [Pterula gracilis]
MSAARSNEYYNSYHGSRRSPQAGELQTGGFFQSDSGGQNIVLPPITTVFPTSLFSAGAYGGVHYSQPRATAGSPGRNYDTNPMVYTSYPSSISSTNYHYDQDYSAYSQYNTHTTPRSMANHSFDSSRRHGTTPASSLAIAVEDRGWPESFANASHGGGGAVYSPMASYPQHYTNHTQHELYSFHTLPDHETAYAVDPRIHHTSHSSSTHRSSGTPARSTDPHLSSAHRSSTPARTIDPHSSSAIRSSTPSRAVDPRNPSPGRSSIPSPTSPTYPGHNHPDASLRAQESAIKKKRRRADANQLKILNEVWERTAFPSTEERAELAKRLDMSPRSVQIWFQNKRQNMRQTSRGGSTATPHQPFAVSPTEDYSEEVPHYRFSPHVTSIDHHTGHTSRSSPANMATSSVHRRTRS